MDGHSSFDVVVTWGELAILKSGAKRAHSRTRAIIGEASRLDRVGFWRRCLLSLGLESDYFCGKSGSLKAFK